MKSYLTFITRGATDVTRFVKVLIKMYQAGSSLKIRNGFVVADNVPCQLIF